MGKRRLTPRKLLALGATLLALATGALWSIPRLVRAPTAPAPGTRIVVSLAQRKLWLLKGRDTVFSAPVAIGKGETFSYRGKTFRFQTPRGQRRVLAKEVDPVWTPPDWHYYERAAREGLEPVPIEEGKEYLLSDGNILEMRGDQVGRINRFGNFWPVTPGTELIDDGHIYIPPRGTAQRKVPDALGTRKLDMGDGYLIHGTHVYNADSVGRAVSHGCIRMRNEDVERLYDMVAVGTPVFIF